MTTQLEDSTSIVARCMSASLALLLTFSLALLLTFSSALVADEGLDSSITDAAFQSQIEPLLKQHCYDCHSGDSAEADIALDSVRSVDQMRGQIPMWLKVRAVLDSDQMPPPDAEPMPSEHEKLLESWTKSFLKQEAAARAGDPGPVILRRLTNAEYTYTIRDLTGVESLEPASEFPVDGAAGEGFTNTGSGQGMSPALVQKYFDAAKKVAEHAMLVPTGVRFSPATSTSDQAIQLQADIRELYARHTERSEGNSISVEGVGAISNEGGGIPLAAYLRATIELRDNADPTPESIAAIARREKIDVKYLTNLWNQLTGNAAASNALPMAKLREVWRKTTNDSLPQLIGMIKTAQSELWKFNSIGHLGHQGGPSRWMEPVPVNLDAHTFRVEQPQTSENLVVTLSETALGLNSHATQVHWQDIQLEYAATDASPARSVSLADLYAQRTTAESSDSLTKATFTIPGDLLPGATLTLTAKLAEDSQSLGNVEIGVSTSNSSQQTENLLMKYLVGTDAQLRMTSNSAIDQFRELFPAALCYTKIVPVDEVVTLSLFYREDDYLKKLMLDNEESTRLDQLWDELYFVSQEPIALTVALEQLSEFATQDRADLVDVFAEKRKPIADRADAFRAKMIESEPVQIQAVVDFAAAAWRRPLISSERQEIVSFYQTLRSKDLSHEAALRLVIARILTAPSFLYKIETSGSGVEATAIPAHELTSRLSYFLWSSIPDKTLSDEAPGLSTDQAIAAQANRMLRDPRMRRFATQFACQWLHLRDFDQNDDKNEEVFPEFAGLRGDMYEETVLFFEHLFRNDGSVLEILDADYTFVNPRLAAHYNLPLPDSESWHRVEGVRDQGRGGVLGMASVLASQSGASRTSPILRGNWVYETLLGERLPRPPANVPTLPETVPSGLTARQLIELHSSDPACAKCHMHIDPYGFALEGYDAIGRRLTDAGDVAATLEDSTEIEGLVGLRDYLANQRRDDFVRLFCRKLLGYALGREVMLSDEPLLESMHESLQRSGYRTSVAIEAIVTSSQFRNIRGSQFSDN